MSKTKMELDDATKALTRVDQFFTDETYEIVDSSLAAPKTVITAIERIIKTKYEARGLTDAKVSFDPSARLQLLIIMRIIYMSANKQGLSLEGNPSTFSKNFDANSLDFQFWKWFEGLVKQSDQDWDMLAMSEIPPEFENVSRVSYAENVEMKIDATVIEFSQCVYTIIIDALATKMTRICWDPSETGSKTKGEVVKGARLSGWFRDMNSSAANTEFLLRIFQASIAFPIVKKDWVASAKERKSKERDAKKAAAETTKKKKEAEKAAAKAAKAATAK